MNVQVDGGVFEIHDFGEARLPLGTCYMDQKTDKEWVYVKANEDLEQGEAVQSVGSISEIDAVAVASVGSNEIDRDGVGSFLTDNTNAIQDLDLDYGERDYERLLVNVTDGTGEGQVGVVTDIAATRIKVEWVTTDQIVREASGAVRQGTGGLKTALDTTSIINFNAPWLVKKGTAGEGVVGFVQFDVEKGNYFWILRSGLGIGKVATGTGLATCDANGELIIGTTDGEMVCQGTEGQEVVAFSLGALVATNSAALVPIQARANQRISVISSKERWT